MNINKLLAIAKSLGEPVEPVEPVEQAKPAEPAKPTKPRIQVRMGGTVTEDMIRKALGIKPKAVQQLKQWLENSPAEHREGGVCPHCRGTGRYRFHTDAHRNEKCFRCHGKGRLDGRDLAFYSRRIQGAAPICHISSAAAA